MRYVRRKVNLPHRHGYPGDGYHYVQCDICGSKIRGKDAVLITQKYSDKANLLVCRADADKSNPQEWIRSFRERQISHPKYIRSEGADRFLADGNEDRLPSAPRHVTIIGAGTGGIEFQWIGPDDVGSSGIIGYAIKRSSPCGGTQTVLVSNTNSISTYYLDTTGDQDTDYGYAVAAINLFGTGAYSEEACYVPSYVVPTGAYLITDANIELVTDAPTTTYLTTDK